MAKDLDLGSVDQALARRRGVVFWTINVDAEPPLAFNLDRLRRALQDDAPSMHVLSQTNVDDNTTGEPFVVVEGLRPLVQE